MNRYLISIIYCLECRLKNKDLSWGFNLERLFIRNNIIIIINRHVDTQKLHLVYTEPSGIIRPMPCLEY